jgi:hypothetical protein
VFDDILRSGKAIFCTAADDNHNKAGFEDGYTDSFGGFVKINADNLEYGEIMSALQKGDFYASTGAEIYKIIRDENKVKVSTCPCKKIHLLTDSRRTEKVLAIGDELVCEAEFSLKESDKYFRIRVEDENGKKAYSQAYFI